MKLGRKVAHHCRLARAVWTGELSCTKVQKSSPNISSPARSSSPSKTCSRYTCWFTLTVGSKKISRVRPLTDTPAQTMIFLGCFETSTDPTASTAADNVGAQTLLFWRFIFCSTTNHYSSENSTWSMEPFARRLSRLRERLTRFCLAELLKASTFRRLYGTKQRSSRSTRRALLTEIPIFSPTSADERVGSEVINLLILEMLFLVLAVVGCHSEACQQPSWSQCIA